MTARAGTSPPERPLLRGWLHATMVPVALAAGWLLVAESTAQGPKRASVMVFGVCLVGLYLTSSLYHVPRWSARARYILSRCDVAMIQLFIAATFTPVAVHTLSGTWRTWSLAIAWTIAVVGAGVAVSPLRGPRWLTVAAYASFGSLAAIPLLRVVGILSPVGTSLLVAGGLLYLVGGVIYARRAPNPWPAWLGFHEVFHLLVVLAGTVHAVAIWRYALPLV